ncbi:MAG: TIGR00180 family glycosyltransferase [Candidatus Paracaedibacter sp.]
MNNQLTLLVYLKDRSEFTKRFVDYLSAIKYPFPVIFADGSIGNENEVFFTLAKKKDFTYEYIRYPKDETLSDYYAKGASAIKKVKTPYVMLVDNDDFPILEGQLKAIDFLDKNQDYGGCNGRVGGVVVNPTASNPYGEKILLLPYYCNSMDRSILLDQETGTKRIKAYLGNFYSIFYSVYRTENLTHTLKKVRELNFSDLGILELFFSYMQLAQGKVHTIDSLTYIRQKGSSQAAASQKDWFHRLFYTEWLSDLKQAIGNVAETIARLENIDFQEVYDLLYEDFLVRHRARFMLTKFYFYKNPRLFFNKEYFNVLILYKIFRVSAVVGEKIGFCSLCHLTPKKNLEKIREIICGKSFEKND